MNSSPAKRAESRFLIMNIPLFFRRFDLSYFKEGACVEYFINRHLSEETISSSLIFSYNRMAKDLHVSRFYPELYLQSESKYLSAVCFYLLIQHCAASYALDDACHISLETVPNVSESFYKKLRDFDFHVDKSGLGNVVELVSDINPLPVDTSMIREHVFQEGEIPFLK